VSSSEVSFSIHFPTTCYDEFAKCRQFKRFQSFVSSFPSFGRGFDSHRPLQILKDLRRYLIFHFCRLSEIGESTDKLFPFASTYALHDFWMAADLTV